MRPIHHNCLVAWKAAAVFLAALLATFVPADGAAPDYKSLPDSFRQVDAAPPSGSGPANPAQGHRRAFISRRTLMASEQSATLEFEIALKMRDLSGLQARVAKGERISLEEMADKYDPSAADYAKVIAWLKSEGFKITRQDNNHLAVFARGKISQIEKSMQMNFARVTADNQEFTSGISAPSIPADLANLIVGINGLQPHLRAHKGVVKPASLTGTGAPYTPSQIAHVYQVDALHQSNITGAGQTIAIVIDTFPATSDLTSFWQTYGISQSLGNVSFIQAVAGTLPAPDGEETLDVEWSSAMAPGAKIRVYASTDLSHANVDQAYQQIYQDVTTHPEYAIHQVSLSYGEGETYTTSSQVQTDAQYFANLAAAGVTVFASSGDGSAFPNQSDSTVGGTRMEQAETPASDPNVTGVGGTTLQLDSSGNVSSEAGWAYGGGGPSIYFTRPSWQIGPDSSTGSQRVTPDVAAAADPTYGAAYYFAGAQSSTGGTSWSSPMWAGFCALINQKRANASLSSIGALGPRIYALIGTSNFRDITSGNNGFPSLSGYDAVTGLGVPNLQTLAQTLAESPVASTYTPPPTQILHNFDDGDTLYDAQLASSMILGSDGNFYGTTAYGGGPNFSEPPGGVFKMTPAGAVTTYNTFHDGTVASGFAGSTSLGQDLNGNFYGATGVAGGTGIFKMTQQGVLTLLYTFPAYENPVTALVAGVDGNLYGITNQNHFFSITPQGGFTAIATLSNFETEDGAYLMRGNDGNFYGVTGFGGYGERGTLFEITPQGVFTVLHEFGVGNMTSDGVEPNSLIQASDGNFYGTTRVDNTNQVTGGTVFKMTQAGVVTILHSFIDGGIVNDGSTPQGLVLGTDGNLYGATNAGGTAGDGIVYEINLGAQNAYTILHNFGDGTLANDGNNGGSLVRAANGNIYGLTTDGGSNNKGTAFVVDYITSASGATFVTGFAGTFNVTTAGMAGATLHATGLPSWATLNSTSGVLSGTPPNATGAPFAVTITAGNGGTTPTIAQSFVLNVVAPTSAAFTSTAPTSSATVGTLYSFLCQASGYPVPTGFTVSAGALPPGVTLSTTGVLTGTPTAGGVYTGTIRVSNGVGVAATQNFSITVQDVSHFTSAPLNTSITVGDSFQYTFSATGYPPPTFQSNESFPAGLTLSADGVLTGTPVKGDGGVYTSTIYAENDYGTYGSSDSQTYTITILEPPTMIALAPANPVLVNTPYYDDFTQDATGYPAATYALTSGAFPPGTTFANGILTGSPTSTGTFTGVVTASNGVAPAATKAFTIVVQSAHAPVFTNATSVNATVGVPFNFQFTASGLPAATLTSSGTLPPGLYEFSYISYPSGTTYWPGIIIGTPTQAGTYNITATAANGTNPNAVQNFTITVAPASFTSWASQYFPTQSATVSGQAATPMGDGVPNLLKYLFDINPTTSMSSTDRAALPTLGTDTTTTPGTEYLTLAYRRNYYASAVQVVLQTSTDMQTWQTVTSPDLYQVTNGGLTGVDSTVEVGMEKPASGPMFMRLNVTSP